MRASTPRPEIREDDQLNLLRRQDWYHFNMTKTEVSQIMSDKSNGSFLVRYSVNQKIYLIEVKAGDRVRTLRIQFEANCGYYIAGPKYFPDIVQLVRYYMRNTFSDGNQDVNIELKYPIETYDYIEPAVEENPTNDPPDTPVDAPSLVQKEEPKDELEIEVRGASNFEEPEQQPAISRDHFYSINCMTAKFFQENWYFPNYDRHDANRLLCNLKTGTFIIRKSTVGSYAISVVKNNSVEHVVVLSWDNMFGVSLTNMEFSSLYELVYFFSENSLELHDVKLDVKLKYPYKWILEFGDFVDEDDD